MIDIVILDFSGDLERTLFSIYIQTIKDSTPLKVYIVSLKKHSKIVSFFQNKMEIEEIIPSNSNKGFMRKLGFDCGKSPFVTFMNSGDAFYDVFSLQNLYKCMDTNDAVIGSIVNHTMKYSNNYVEGNLYRRKYLMDNDILYSDFEGEFHKLFLASNPKFVFNNDSIYFMESFEKFPFTQNNLEEVILSVSIAKSRNYLKEKIALILYDTLLYYSYLLDSDFFSVSQLNFKIFLNYFDRYKKYMDDSLKQYVSDINLTNFDHDILVVNKFLTSVK